VSKSGHKLEVITLDSSDEETVEQGKKDGESEAALETAGAFVGDIAPSSSDFVGINDKSSDTIFGRKRRGNSVKKKTKKFKQMFGSDSETDGKNIEPGSSSYFSDSSASTESLPSSSNLIEQFSPISSDDCFLSPAKTSPNPVEMSQGRQEYKIVASSSARPSHFPSPVPCVPSAPHEVTNFASLTAPSNRSTSAASKPSKFITSNLLTFSKGYKIPPKQSIQTTISTQSSSSKICSKLSNSMSRSTTATKLSTFKPPLKELCSYSIEAKQAFTATAKLSMSSTVSKVNSTTTTKLSKPFTAGSLLEPTASQQANYPESDQLLKLAAKIKASRQLPHIKLEVPVLTIKKELSDSELPTIPVVGYSQEPEVITIIDSDDEDDYDAKHSQTQNEADLGQIDNDPIDFFKEEVMSDEEELKLNAFEDAEDEEEIEILQSSENKLFAAISKRIKVEFDPTILVNLDDKEVDEIDDKEKNMIVRLMDAVGCDEDMAVCAIAQAKEIYDCPVPSFEQTVKVITGEDDESSSDEDERVARDAKSISPELRGTHYCQRPVSACSDTSRDSVDDLLEGLEDEEPVNKDVKSPKPNCSKDLQTSGSKSSISKKRLYGEKIRNLFDDDDNSWIESESSNSTSSGGHRKSIGQNPVSSPSVKPKSSGSKLIEPLAMPLRRGLSQKTAVGLNDTERKNILETLQKSKPRLIGKLFQKHRNHTGYKGQMAVERKQKLAEIAAKSKKIDAVKITSAPVGIMKMSKPKSQNLLLEMSSCTLMQPKRKVSKPKIDIKRSQLCKKMLDNVNQEQPFVPSEPSEDTISYTEKNDPVKLDEDQKKLYSETSDGYLVPKKMSVSNIAYQVAEKPEFSVRLPEPQRARIGSILRRKCRKSVKKKHVGWRDQNGFHALMEVRDIPAENNGTKCSTKNNKDGCVKAKDASDHSETKTIKKDVLMDDIFFSILNWNTAWLEEQKKMAEPPPVHQPWQLIPVTNTFSSWDEYRKIFLPLMLHELWSLLSREYEEKKLGREDVVPVCLQEVVQDPKGQFLVVRCMGLLSEQECRRDCGVEGTLVQLNFSFNLGSVGAVGRQAREIKPCFGYVQNIKKFPFRKDYGNLGEFDSERIKKLETLSVKNKNRTGMLTKLVHYTIRVKLALVPPGRKLSSEKPIYMKSLSRIRPEMRKFEAILDLPQTRLFNSIVSPDGSTLAVPKVGHHPHATIATIPAISHLNQDQKQIIVSVSQACVLQPEAAKICLVQGPPGTGKSSTISGLILQILCSKLQNGKNYSLPRILVVAPSNAAVDELALKLISLKYKLPEGIKFKLLRLGVQHSMHHGVRMYSYDAQVGQYIAAKTRQAKAIESLEKDERSKQAAANQIYAEKLQAEADGKVDLASKLNRDYREKVQQIEKIKTELRKPLDTRSRKDLERLAAEKTMAEADIILSTLSSSTSAQMEKYFVHGVGTSKSVGNMRPISVCIMDEASQCVEPEALIPLKLGFCKLVMVGDHEQLPATVTSRKAQQLDYQQSLFGRLFSYFTGLAGEGCSPVLRLFTQYRMHQEISSWPARYFYGGRLVTGPQDRGSSLAPYTVIQVRGEARQQGGHCWNKQEEMVVIETILAVKALVGDNMSIGVITFYAKQKQNISLEVQNRRLNNIVVNTVDGFQGSERDVIIISCVRGGTGGIGFLQDRQRLNVALTRAKYSMVAVGNIETLSGASEMWAELARNAESRNTLYRMEVNSVSQGQLRLIMGRSRVGLP